MKDLHTFKINKKGEWEPGYETTYTVGFSASESACSGIPYTWFTPGNEMSIPMELGPENGASTCK